jgi:hypothetical protein
MSYLPETTGLVKTKLLADTFYQDGGGANVNNSFQYIAPSPLNTGITLGSSTDFTVYSGSSWYLEFSPGVKCSGRNGITEIQLYNVTSSQWIGQSAYMCLQTSLGSSARQGRRVARALILDSEISTSAMIQLRIKSIFGTGWSMIQNSTGMAQINYAGAACARVVELPS